jgi:hypothetical protein
MNGQEKSDPGTVAVKPTNKAGRPAAESVEPRPGTEGNAGQQSTHRAQNRARVTQALDRVRHAASPVRRQTPKVGATCGKAARVDLCGGRSATGVPTAIIPRHMWNGRARQVLSLDISSSRNGAVICPAFQRGHRPLALMKFAKRGTDQSDALDAHCRAGLSRLGISSRGIIV